MLVRKLARLQNAVLVVSCHGADVFALRGRAWDAVRHWVKARAGLVLPVSQGMADALGVAEEFVVPMGAARVLNRLPAAFA